MNLSKAFDKSYYQKLNFIKTYFVKVLLIKHLKIVLQIFSYDNIKYF